MKLPTYILIIVLLLSASFNTVKAEPPPAKKLPSINGALTDFAETKFGGTEAIDILAGTTFGFELQDIILPIYNKVKQIAAPDFKPLGIGTMQTYNKYLIPESLNDTIIHYSDINENIATSIFCAVIRNRSKYGKKSLTIAKSGVQKSSNFEYSQEAFENLRKANAVYGLLAVEPNAEGFLDFNLPSMYHPAGTAKCGKQYTSEEDKPVENDVTELASWGGGTGTVEVTNTWETLYNWVKKIVSGLPKLVPDGYKKFFPSYEAVLTENTRPSNFEQLAHAGDATEKDVENAADEETKKLAKSRGLAFAYLPEEKSTDPNEHAGKTEYSYNIKSLSLEGNDVFDGKNGGIEHPWLLVNNAKFRTCQMARSVVPDGLTTGKSIGDGSKGDIVLDEKCPEKAPVEEPEKLQCPIDVIKEKAKKPSDNKCSLTNPKSLLSYMKGPDAVNPNYPDQKLAYGSGLSPLAVKILETAADTYKVPASVLYGTMLFEGAFNHPGVWNWSDDAEIEKYSDCNNPEPMPSCNSFAIFSGSKAPFGFIDSWWDKYMEGGKNPYDGKFFKVELEGMDEVLKKMTPDQFNSCNFADAAFMAAREISEDSSHPIGPVPNICQIPPPFGNIPMFTGNYRPESCSSWTADRVATSRYQYGGGSSQNTCTPQDTANSFNIGYMIDIWKASTP